ncbi:hypothetical protein RQP46_011261 [Phenoliferia psychrophenolica]
MHLLGWTVTIVACFTAVNAFEWGTTADGLLAKRRTEASPCGHNEAGKNFHHSAKKGCVECGHNEAGKGFPHSVTKGCVECGHSSKGEELYLTTSKTCVPKCPQGFVETRKCDHVAKHHHHPSKPAHSSFVTHAYPHPSHSTARAACFDYVVVGPGEHPFQRGQPLALRQHAQLCSWQQCFGIRLPLRKRFCIDSVYLGGDFVERVHRDPDIIDLAVKLCFSLFHGHPFIFRWCSVVNISFCIVLELFKCSSSNDVTESEPGSSLCTR